MKYCAECGTDVEGMKFCPRCGYKNTEEEFPQVALQKQALRGEEILSAKKKPPILAIVLIVGLVIAAGSIGMFFFKSSQSTTLKGLAKHEINILELPLEEAELEKYFNKYGIYREEADGSWDTWRSRTQEAEKFTLFKQPLNEIEVWYDDEFAKPFCIGMEIGFAEDADEILGDLLMGTFEEAFGRHVKTDFERQDDLFWLCDDRVIGLSPLGAGRRIYIYIVEYEAFNEFHPEELRELENLNK